MSLFARFVMELVKGVPLTQFCDDNKLAARERLRLFAIVCKAIQHAHHKGVIHRDIKPSNVMVTLHDGQPVPKVIDFGVSKAITQQLTEKTMFTAYGQMIGTPQYMSPEQAEMSGLDIDTRSDVYSLGVLLYELLTGSTPLGAKSLRGKAYAELQRMIREDEPPRPSLRVSTQGAATASIAAQRGTGPRELGALLRGELDWIVMKALEKNRDRRYETANSFAADIERYLNNEAVEACPPSALYRVRKFIGRNRVACTTGALVAVSLLGGVLISAMATRDALYQRRLAEETLIVALSDRKSAEQATSRAQQDRAAAEKSKQDETAHRQKAEEQSQAAEMARRDEAAARAAAERERDNASRLNEELKRQQERQQRTIYVARMNLVQRAWDTDNQTRVRELLRLARPRPGEADLRGIEWHYWQRLSHLGKYPPAPEFSDEFAVMSADGSRIATIQRGTPDAEIKISDRAQGKQLSTVRLAQVPACVALSDSGDKLATVSAAGAESWELQVWSTDTGERKFQASFTKHSPPTAATAPVPLQDILVVFSPDGQRLATSQSYPGQAQGRREIRVWSLAERRLLHAIAAMPHRGSARMEFSAGGDYLLCTADGLAEREADQQSPADKLAWNFKRGFQVFDAATGRQLFWDPKPVSPLAFSPDGTRLAGVRTTAEAGGQQRSALVVWEVPSGKEVSQLAVSSGRGLGAVALSHDNQQAALAQGSDVALYRVASGEELLTLAGHAGPVREIAFGPDGQRIATCCLTPRAETKVWDVATGQEVLSLAGAGRGLQFGTQTLLASTATAHFWDAAALEPQLESKELVEWLLSADDEGRFATRGEIAARIEGDASIGEEVRSLAQQLAKTAVRDPQKLVQQAVELVRSADRSPERLERALALATEASDQDAANADAWLWAGAAQLRLNQTAASLVALEHSQKLRKAAGQPATPTLLAYLAMAHHQAGHAALAQESLRQADRLLSAGDSTIVPRLMAVASSLWSASEDEILVAEGQEKLGIATASSHIRLGAKSMVYDNDQAIKHYSEAIRLDPQNAQAYHWRGIAWENKREYDRAIEDLDEAVRLAPNSAQLLYNRGIAYQLKGNNSQAIADFTEAIRLDPKFALAYVNRARRLTFIGDLDGAVRDLTRAVELEPAHTASYTTFSRELATSRQRRPNLAELDEAIQREPNIAEHYYRRGLARHGLGEYALAIHDYDQALNISPNYTDVRYNRGVAFNLSGEYDLAIRDFDAVPMSSVRYGEALAERGLAWMRKGEFEKAHRDIDSAMAAASPAVFITPVRYRYDRARVWLAQGDDAKALDQLNATIERSPRYANAYATRSEVWRRRGDLDRAQADASKSVEMDKKAQHYATLAGIHRLKGELELALADCEAGLALEPKNPWALFNRGRVYREQGEYEKARADFSAAIEFWPKHPWAYADRASEFIRSLRPQEALQDCERALALDPRLGWAYAVRGNVRDEQGRFAEARADYDTAIELDPWDERSLNTRAWFLATCVDDKFRDPTQAILDATKACELTAWRSPRNLDTLAASHAAGRDFPAAVKRQQQALDLAMPANRSAYRSRLELYQSNQPYRAAPRFPEPAMLPAQH